VKPPAECPERLPEPRMLEQTPRWFVPAMLLLALCVVVGVVLFAAVITIVIVEPVHAERIFASWVRE